MYFYFIGDIAFRYLDFLEKQPNPDQRSSRVTVCDINESMLSIGKSRAEKLGYTDENKINWVLGDAENLPIESNSIDAYTISFGIRNVTHIDRVGTIWKMMFLMTSTTSDRCNWFNAILFCRL